jgi:hypothetical protein
MGIVVSNSKDEQEVLGYTKRLKCPINRDIAPTTLGRAKELALAAVHFSQETSRRPMKATETKSLAVGDIGIGTKVNACGKGIIYLTPHIGIFSQTVKLLLYYILIFNY